jgi:hypothetical protein
MKFLTRLVTPKPDKDGKQEPAHYEIYAKINDVSGHISRWEIERSVVEAVTEHYKNIMLEKFVDYVANEVKIEQIIDDARMGFRESIKKTLTDNLKN